jgi:hypothetical protein
MLPRDASPYRAPGGPRGRAGRAASFGTRVEQGGPARGVRAALRAQGDSCAPRRSRRARGGLRSRARRGRRSLPRAAQGLPRVPAATCARHRLRLRAGPRGRFELLPARARRLHQARHGRAPAGGGRLPRDRGPLESRRRRLGAHRPHPGRSRALLRGVDGARAERRAPLSVAVPARRRRRGTLRERVSPHASARRTGGRSGMGRIRDLSQGVRRLPRDQRRGGQGRTRPECAAQHRRVPSRGADQGVRPGPGILPLHQHADFEAMRARKHDPRARP